jgi:mRNA interferase HigB
MRVIALGTLREFWRAHPDAETPLRSWYAEVRRANWPDPAAIKSAHRNASFLKGDRTVFNIKGNDYRLVVAVRYRQQIMYVRFIGKHRDYDRIDAASI